MSILFRRNFSKIFHKVGFWRIGMKRDYFVTISDFYQNQNLHSGWQEHPFAMSCEKNFANFFTIFLSFLMDLEICVNKLIIITYHEIVNTGSPFLSHDIVSWILLVESWKFFISLDKLLSLWKFLYGNESYVNQGLLINNHTRRGNNIKNDHVIIVLLPYHPSERFYQKLSHLKHEIGWKMYNLLSSNRIMNKKLVFAKNPLQGWDATREL